MLLTTSLLLVQINQLRKRTPTSLLSQQDQKRLNINQRSQWRYLESSSENAKNRRQSSLTKLALKNSKDWKKWEKQNLKIMGQCNRSVSTWSWTLRNSLSFLPKLTKPFLLLNQCLHSSWILLLKDLTLNHFRSMIWSMFTFHLKQASRKKLRSL